ncbi:MAG: TM2 domain-containing protein [Rubrivivax sp.]
MLHRSRTMAAWLAVLLGVFGVHRLYLHGWRDPWAWLFPVPTLLGLYGAIRMRNLGVDDTLGSLLVPLLGVMVAVAMLSAIVAALMSGETWARRYGSGGSGRAGSDAATAPTAAANGPGIGSVLAAIVALLVGGAALMATLAFSAQKFFEWQLAQPQAQSSGISFDTTWSATAETNAVSGPSRG